MRLFVIRHAETEFNRECLIQGDLDSQLTELGVRQTLLLAKELSGIEIDTVFSSTARRAYDTAKPLAQPRRLPIVMVPDLRERDFGEFEGKNLTETKSAHPEYFTTTAGLDFEAKPKGGESLNDVAARSLHFLRRLISHFQGKTVVIVSHGVVNKLIIGELLDGTLTDIAKYRQANCSINELLVQNGKGKAVRLNYTGHLKDARR